MGIFGKLFKGSGRGQQDQNESPVALTRQAFYLVEKGHNDEAIQCLKRAIDLDPQCGDAYNELAFIYGKMKGDLDTSEEFARKANECDPSNPKFWNTLNSIQRERLKTLRTKKELLDKVTERMRAIDRSIMDNPNYAPAYLAKAAALAMIGERKDIWEADLKKAEDLYEKFGDLGNDLKATPYLIDTIITRNRRECEELNEAWNLRNELSYPRHYEDMLRKTGGPKRKIILANIDTNGPYLALEYQWADNLTHAEADDLDTRVRAFISCAIYDAAKEADLLCSPGPLFGIRPSWIIDNRNIPYSIIEGRFDASEKTCYGVIGPCMMLGGYPSQPVYVADQLAKGFMSCFSAVTV